MKKLNQILTADEQKELSSDFEYVGFSNEKSYIYNESYLPQYVKEAMKKNGVVRTLDGKFVKISR